VSDYCGTNKGLCTVVTNKQTKYCTSDRGITSGDVVSHKKYTGYLRTQEKLALTKWSDTILNKNRKAIEARHLEN
jgi:hypothetical protein